MRRENVRHATLLFRAEGGEPVKQMAWENERWGMTREERADMRAFEADMWNMLHPKVTIGDVAQKFDTLVNKQVLINGFETGRYNRYSFCQHFKCKKWVYDFLSDMAKIKDIKVGVKIIEKNRADAVKNADTRLTSERGANRPLTRVDFNEPTMIVVVNKSWEPSFANSPSLYDCARGYWRVGFSGQGKAYKCRYVIASYYGRVAEVYEINRSKSWMTWRESPKATWLEDKPENPMRRAFEGRIAPSEIRAKYIGRSTSGLILPGTEKVYVGF